MKICLDASVAVAAHRAQEPSHIAARARVDRVLAGTDQIVVPVIFPIEVAAALTRAGVDANVVAAYLNAVLSGGKVVTIGPKRMPLIVDVAMRTKLRAADACYAWVASTRKVRLVTLDAEVLKRAASVCTVERP